MSRRKRIPSQPMALQVENHSMLCAEIVECVRISMRANGLSRAQADFEGIEHILSHLPWWAEVKRASDGMFAKERKRMERMEQERIKASVPHIIQEIKGSQVFNGAVTGFEVMGGNRYGYE